VYRADGFDGESVGGFGAIEDDWLPDAKPVFNVGGGSGLDPAVNGLIGVSNE
jgi:hypothetical protein